MNLRQRCQAVFEAGYQLGQQSNRRSRLGLNSLKVVYIALSIDSEREIRILNRLCGRLKLDSSGFICWFWRLSLLGALQGGCGCERLSEFFHLLRLPRHIGVSPSALRTLRSRIEKLNGLKQTHQLKDLKGSLDKFRRQIQQLTAVVDLWWSWVDCCLSSHNLDSHLQVWVKQHLLPAVYWQQ